MLSLFQLLVHLSSSFSALSQNGEVDRTRTEARKLIWANKESQSIFDTQRCIFSRFFDSLKTISPLHGASNSEKENFSWEKSQKVASQGKFAQFLLKMTIIFGSYYFCALKDGPLSLCMSSQCLNAVEIHWSKIVDHFYVILTDKNSPFERIFKQEMKKYRAFFSSRLIHIFFILRWSVLRLSCDWREQKNEIKKVIRVYIEMRIQCLYALQCSWLDIIQKLNRALQSLIFIPLAVA